MTAFPTPIQCNFEVPSQSNKTRERKEIQIGKEEVKLSLLVDGMILYLKEPKSSTKNI
jgi:hypothetical protein